LEELLSNIIFDHKTLQYLCNVITVVPFYKANSSAVKKWPYKEGWPLLRLTIYYFSASEIWPDKKVGFWCDGPYKRGVTAVIFLYLYRNFLCFRYNDMPKIVRIVPQSLLSTENKKVSYVFLVFLQIIFTLQKIPKIQYCI
jgi:hypothetical protein